MSALPQASALCKHRGSAIRDELSPSPMQDLSALPPALQIADWRQRMFAIYAAVRSAPSPDNAHAIWTERRRALFQTHPQSPTRDHGFTPANVFRYEPSLRFCVAVQPIAEAPSMAVETGSDGTLRLQPALTTDGLAHALGAELTIYALEGYAGGLFLPFRDGSSGQETYGGGRYLIDTIKGADLGLDPDGRMILDFNFAYHPSCFHSPEWVCPLAAPENNIPMPVRGGERV